MARVSLIVVRGAGAEWPHDRSTDTRDALKASGHDVEVDAISVESGGIEGRGLAIAAIDGVRRADGELLLVLDAGMGYSAADLVAVADRLAAGDVEIVVASRNAGPSRRLAGRLLGAVVRPILGTTDPFAGLIGMTSGLARSADALFRPVGSRFALEVLARAEGRREDVAVSGRVASAKRSSIGLGDIRQAKRLADDRFGNVSRLLQFCFVGASGMVVDLVFYALFQKVFAATPMAVRVAPVVGGSLAMAAARVSAIAIALTWNFSLNRRLTFNDARRGSIAREYVRYVLSNMAGVLLSLTLSLTLPNLFGFFRAHRLAAAVVGIVAATGVSFTLTRFFVFGRRPTPVEDVASLEPVPLDRNHAADRPVPVE